MPLTDPMARLRAAVGQEPTDPMSRLRAAVASVQEPVTLATMKPGDGSRSLSDLSKNLRRELNPNTPFRSGMAQGASLGWAGEGIEGMRGLKERAAHVAGQVVGTIPMALGAAAGTTAIAGRVAARAASPAVRAAARYLSEPAAKASQAAVQNVAQGLTFSATTEPFRNLGPDATLADRAKSVALNTALGVAIDAPAGTVVGRGARARAAVQRERQKGVWQSFGGLRDAEQEAVRRVEASLPEPSRALPARGVNSPIIARGEVPPVGRVENVQDIRDRGGVQPVKPLARAPERKYSVAPQRELPTERLPEPTMAQRTAAKKPIKPPTDPEREAVRSRAGLDLMARLTAAEDVSEPAAILTDLATGSVKGLRLQERDALLKIAQKRLEELRKRPEPPVDRISRAPEPTISEAPTRTLTFRPAFRHPSTGETLNLPEGTFAHDIDALEAVHGSGVRRLVEDATEDARGFVDETGKFYTPKEAQMATGARAPESSFIVKPPRPDAEDAPLPLLEGGELRPGQADILPDTYRENPDESFALIAERAAAGDQVAQARLRVRQQQMAGTQPVGGVGNPDATPAPRSETPTPTPKDSGVGEIEAPAQTAQAEPPTPREVEFGKPSTYQGRKRIEVRQAGPYDPEEPRLYIVQERQGGKTYLVERRGWSEEPFGQQSIGRRTSEKLGQGLSLKDAKKLAAEQLGTASKDAPETLDELVTRTRSEEAKLATDDLFGVTDQDRVRFRPTKATPKPDAGPPKGSGSNRPGFVDAAILRAATPAITGTAGALYGATKGDNAEERRNYALSFGLIGAGLGAAPRALRTARPGALTVPEAGRSMFRKVFAQASDYMRKEGGQAGGVLADDVDLIDKRMTRRVGVQDQDMSLAYAPWKKKHKEAELLNKYANGRKSGVRAYEKLGDAEKAQWDAAKARILEVADRDMNDMAALGGTRNVGGEQLPIKGSGKPFPQALNEKGMEAMYALRKHGVDHPDVQRMAQAMVDEGFAADFDEAVKRLDKYREAIEGRASPVMDIRNRGLDRYLQSSRFELPEDYVDWSPEVWKAVLHRNAAWIESTRLWGLDAEAITPFIKMISEQARPDVAKTVQNFLRFEFGLPGLEDRAQSALLGRINNYETIVRLGYSPFSIMLQASQQAVNLAHLPLAVQLKTLKKYPPVARKWIEDARALTDWAERTGNVRGKSAYADLQEAPGQKVADKVLKGFIRMAQSNERRSAIAARFALEHDFNLVMKKYPEETKGIRRFLDIISGSDVKVVDGVPEGAPVRRLEKLGIDPERLAEKIQNGESLTENELVGAAYHLVTDTQFPLTLATKPIWWGTNPKGRLLFKFKTFGARQTEFIYRNVLKEAAQGNVAPLAKFTATAILMGEIYNLSRDKVLGSDRSITGAVAQGKTDDLWLRVFNDLKATGGLGMVFDVSYGISDWVLGPAANTLGNIASAAVQATYATAKGQTEQIPDIVQELGRKEVTAARAVGGVKRRVQELFDGEERQFFEYADIKNKARSFARGEREFGEQVSEAVSRTALGLPEFGITEKSVPYRAGANAIQSGDLKRAARIFGIVLKAEDAERGLRQSLDRAGPMGGLNKEERRAFLNSLDAEDRRNAIQLERQWDRDVNRAIMMARRKARR